MQTILPHHFEHFMKSPACMFVHRMVVRANDFKKFLGKQVWNSWADVSI